MAPPAPEFESYEAMASRFLDEAEKLTIEQWSAICQRYEAALEEITSALGRIGKDTSDLAFRLMTIPKEKEKRIGFNRQLHQRKLAVVASLRETIQVAGTTHSLRVIANSAMSAVTSAMMIFDERIQRPRKEALVAAVFRPFYGFITLPAFDYDTAPARPQRKEKSAKGVFHVGFPENYFTYSEPLPKWMSVAPMGWFKKLTFHETWNLPRNPGLSCDLGGSYEQECAVCGGSLHHLLTLPAVAGLPVTGLQQLVIVSCLSCLGWTEPRLFFRHEKSGLATPTSYSGPTTKPQFPAKPIRKATIVLCETAVKWSDQPWGDSTHQNLNRIGGKPSWVQDRESATCPQCRKSMAFLAQLDSGLPSEDGKRWPWGSGGVLFIFWCDACKIDAQFWQCT
ncbi:MAG: hypothetical protein JWO95_1945 [Verrucomicrobiales bacterium]|nr:hypothetical protein [Verrucomicrobiales bacterium]